MKKNSNNKVKKARKVIIISIACAVLLVGTLKFFFEPYEYKETTLLFPAKITQNEVRELLTHNLGKTFGYKAYFLWLMQGGTPEKVHGAYEVKHNTTPVKLARRLATGRQTPVKFTFNNLRQTSDLAKRAAKAFEMDSLAFDHAMDSVLTARGYMRDEFAAAFLPDTYEFYWTSSPTEVVDGLLEAHDKFWNDQRKAKAAALGLTPVQVATLASIVESESNKRIEHGQIARMYLNRIDKNMPLQADPTVKFALKEFGLRRITGQHTRVESPFNTYRIKGLPPGPITIPDARTIDAVLNAPQHNYLYMCAKEDFSGTHRFAATYDEHRINAARYHRALNARGIRR